MNWHKYGIDITKVHGGKTYCPKCHDTRKNKQDKSLSVDLSTGLFNCHNHPCDFRGCADESRRSSPGIKKDYTKPPERLQKVSDEILTWFQDVRGISNNTLLRLKVTEHEDKEFTWVCFNYYRDGELVNIKYRGPDKQFRLSPGAELIFYNLDALKGETECILNEGELEVLTNVECGIYNSVSVPNGASIGANHKLEYLDNCWEAFEGMTKIILATDNDAPGIALRDELARRFGKHRCYKVEYPPECKDTNDVLLKYGKDAVKEMYNNARPWPLEGIKTLEDFYPEVQQLYDQGYPKGLKAGIPGFDDHASFNTMNGELWTVVGIPNHGKSEFMDLIMAKTAVNLDFKWGVCAFETPYVMHTSLLMEKISGKAFGFRADKTKRMNQWEAEHAVAKIDSNFFFFDLDDDSNDLTPDGLIEKFRQLVVSRGVNAIVLDPWSYVEVALEKGQTETQFVQQSLIKMKKFCKAYGVHIFIVCHPTKMYKDEKTGKYHIPTLYSVNGSSYWFSLTDNGICVYRNFDTGITDVHIQKWKRSWLGNTDMVSFMYDTQIRQYNKVNF